MKTAVLTKGEVLELIATSELTGRQIAARAGTTSARVTQMCQEVTGLSVLEFRALLGWPNQTTPPRVARAAVAYYLSDGRRKLAPTARALGISKRSVADSLRYAMAANEALMWGRK